MKNQYFGDIRDLFKYDLALEIIATTEGISKLFYIPMLTPDGPGSDGSRVDYQRARAGYHNLELRDYLSTCLQEGRRDIREIKDFFLARGIQAEVYGEDHHFLHERRGEYFRGIDPGKLRGALILVDPDNGLEVKDPGDKHLLYSEVKYLYRRMHEDSILMIYQHLPRQHRPTYIYGRTMELKQLTGRRPLYLSDNEIIFFLLAKEEKQLKDLCGAIARYRERYPRLTVEILTSEEARAVGERGDGTTPR